MAPYRHIRYWLSDFRCGDKAKGKQEIFNQCHSRLRNVIERAFGVLKARFPILKMMPSYTFGTQRNIVVACIALHNFLRKISIDDALFKEYSNEDLEVENENANHNQPPSTNHDFRISDQVFMQHFRDRIANQLLERSI